ncbi:hypothetical protein ACO0SA_001063 [Hanseniaspora valbyensis]
MSQVEVNADRNVLKYNSSIKQFSIGNPDYIKDIFEINNVWVSFMNSKSDSLEGLDFKKFTKTNTYIKERNNLLLKQAVGVFTEFNKAPQNKQTYISQLQDLLKENAKLISEKIVGDSSGYSAYASPSLENELKTNGEYLKTADDKYGSSLLETPFQATMEELELSHVVRIQMMNFLIRMKYQVTEKVPVPGQEGKFAMKITFLNNKESKKDLTTCLEMITFIKDLGSKAFTQPQFQFLEIDLLMKGQKVKEAREKIMDLQPMAESLNIQLMQLGILNSQTKTMDMAKVETIFQKQQKEKLPGPNIKEQMMMLQKFSEFNQILNSLWSQEYGL